MKQRLSMFFLLGVILLEGRRVTCQSKGEASGSQGGSSLPSAISPGKPDARECLDQIAVRENQLESLVGSASFWVEITIQELKKCRKCLPVPEAVNFYRVLVTFGNKTKIHEIFKEVHWRPLWWQFDLRGFAEMCFLDRASFDKSNYSLQYSGEKMLLGRRCWVYRVASERHTPNWHFEGTIWVLAEELTIIRFQGEYQPTRRIHWPFPVEEFWFYFDSWRKEISPGEWAPDFVCAGVDVAKSNFIEPAFRARIRYSNKQASSTPSETADTACGTELGNFPTKNNEQNRNPGAGNN